MSVTASVVDGVLQQTSTSAASLSESTVTSNSALDKDDFLKLLVAQMQYQDPLEPTSNTEYISQFATFSELEQMQNVSSSMDMSRASSLVGKTVIVKVTSNSTGETSYITGKVDYVMYENNKAYLSINDSLYSIDDLDTVVDETYLEAYNLAGNVASEMKKLPAVDKLTLENRVALEKILEVYDGMNEYQKSFLGEDVQKLLESYRTKLKELLAAKEASKGETE